MGIFDLKRCCMCNKRTICGVSLKDNHICFSCALKIISKGKIPSTLTSAEALSILTSTNTSVPISQNNKYVYTSKGEFTFPQKDRNGNSLLTVYDLNVTGTMHLHDGIDPQLIIPQLFEGDQILLEADPNNKYDSSAVKVKTTQGWQIGWLPSDEKLQYDVFCRLMEGQEVYARVNKGYLLDYYPGKIGLVIDIARYHR